MINLKHRSLAVLSHRIPWAQIESALAPCCIRRDRRGEVIAGEVLFGATVEIAGGGPSKAGRCRPSRLMPSLLYLKHAYNLSDEEVIARWAENVVWQYFSGQTYYEPRMPCDATQVGRFRTAIGEAGVEELLKATIDMAIATKAIHPSWFDRVSSRSNSNIPMRVLRSTNHPWSAESNCCRANQLEFNIFIKM
jgi:IS5 family transposase